MGVAGHPLDLVGHHHPSLAARIMRGDAAGTGVLVALERLHATQGEQEATSH